MIPWRLINITCSISLFCITVKAQDVSFSQFFNNVIYLNPAIVGNSENDYRFNLDYRNQWNSISDPYKSTALSFDMPVYQNVVDKKYFGFGAGYFNDETGSTSLKSNIFSLALSYHVQTDRYNTVSGGLIGNFGQRSIDFSAVKWENQHNGNNYDPSLPTGETDLSDRFNYWDVGAGIAWEYIEPNLEINTELGLAVYHINQPNQSFAIKNAGRLKRKWQLHGTYDVKLPSFTLLPKAIVIKQATLYSFTAGSLVKFRPDNTDESRYTDFNIKSYAYLGVFYRFRDAMIFQMMYEYRHMFKAGISYDITISGLRKYNKSRGGFEITLVYDGIFTNNKISVKSKTTKDTKINTREKL